MSTTREATELVLQERHDGVLTITINRPAQRNAVNHEVAAQLAFALDLLDTDPALSLGVLTATRIKGVARWFRKKRCAT
jgi:enoyl-CoA hydratase